jgi:CRP/FNR family transcriptional regulator, anaerobic regulatory protein
MLMTPCASCPLRRRPIFTPMTDDELTFMERFKVGELVVNAGAAILSQGESSPQLFTVLEGMATRSILLENGRRQVINFVFPGDFMGLQAGVMGESRHSVDAATTMRLCVFNRAALWDLFRSSPDRGYDLTWIAAVEEHFLGETIASLGQRDASQRVSWALLQIFQRLAATGLQTGDSVPFPFRQQDLADALGLSLVHTNKTLAALRGRGLLSWSQARLMIHDLNAVAEIAMVDVTRPLRRPLM